MTPNDIWKMVRELLQKDLTQVTMDAWFSDLTAVEFQNDRFVLHTPDSVSSSSFDFSAERSPTTST